MKKQRFNIDNFSNLPKNLKKSDYIDMLLFLLDIKQCVRLGSNDAAAYSLMIKWCAKYKYAYVLGSSQLMYIAKNRFIAKIAQIADDSKYNHSYTLGRLLGYPGCCCKKIASVGENNIDEFEKALAQKGFSPPFDIINPAGYIEGYAFISHVPCCSTCIKSLRIAKSASNVIENNLNFPNINSWKIYWYSD